MTNTALRQMLRDTIIEQLNSQPNEILSLEESVNSFAQLPDSWKKIAVGGEWKGGNDSKVEVVAASKKIRDAQAILNIFRKALRRDGAAFVWVEMNGEPLVGVSKSSHDNTYRIHYPDGDSFKKTVRVKHHGTDKYDRRMGKYIPASYYNRKESSLKPTEAVESMWDIAYKTLDAINKDAEEPRASVFELAQEMQFEVRMMLRDSNRAEISAERKAARGGTRTDWVDHKSLIANRKVAVEKLVMSKITPVIDSIKSEVDVQVNNAITGKLFDFKKIETELTRIRNVSSRLAKILNADDVRLRKSSWHDEKATLDYDLKYLMDELKDI